MIKELDMYENVDMPGSQGVYIGKHLNLWLNTLCLLLSYLFKFTRILGNIL
jgi:hypothetical protein